MDIAIRRAEPGDYEGVWRTFQDESVYTGTLIRSASRRVART
jgi:hypothetical protein